MRKLVACVALAVAAAVPATLALDAGPAHADETNSCRWYVDGQDYSAGTVKVEDWGVSRTPDGRWVRTFGHGRLKRPMGLAATRKVRELGERREQRRAEKYQATEAALRVADELGIDLAELNGTGSEGRITVKDVREAQEA